MTPNLPPLPEPDASDGDVFIRYTAEALRTYAAEAVRVARLQALEDAALLAEGVRKSSRAVDSMDRRLAQCVSAIRALKDRK